MDAVSATSRKTIAISANCAWNLINFRKPIIRDLIGAGWKVVALVPSDELTPALSSLGVEVHSIAMDAQGISPVRDSVLLLRYYRALREIRPAVFLAFTPKPNVYGSAAASWIGIPCINTVSGLGTGFLSGRALQAVMATLYRWGMRRSHRIFFHNEDDLNLFIAARIVRKEQARVVKGSGVNLIEYVPRVPCEQSDHGPTFLFIGRLLKDKGLREFIAAAAEVKKTLVATFQVIGSLENHPKAIPPSAIMDAVEKGHIELVGSTGDVRPFLECADCLILPSYREGLPRVILEAAAMAKPVIATDVPGCRDAVDSGLTGFLCEARSASSLVDAIHRFAATPQEERVAMGLRARAKAQREFSEEKVVAAYAEAIGGLVIQAQSYGHGEALA